MISRYVADITGCKFAEHTLNVRKRACLVKCLYSGQLVMRNVPQGRYYGKKKFNVKWHCAGGWRSVKCYKVQFVQFVKNNINFSYVFM